MPQEMGETREAWGRDVWNAAQDFAERMRHVDKPFFIVYACKEDKGMSNSMGRPVFKQCFKAYFARPPKLIGVLVWYVNHMESRFELVPELSLPPDVPVDPSLLSTDSHDMSARVAESGKNAGVLLS